MLLFLSFWFGIWIGGALSLCAFASLMPEANFGWDDAFATLTWPYDFLKDSLSRF